MALMNLDGITYIHLGRLYCILYLGYNTGAISFLVFGLLAKGRHIPVYFDKFIDIQFQQQLLKVICNISMVLCYRS